MSKKVIKIFNVAVCGALIFQLAGCGTILYPERKGQTDGRLDIGIVLLDGVGLFFFIIPGLIAYGIDFSNGTIYLPGKTSSVQSKNLKQVKFDPKHFNIKKLEKIISDETGQMVKIDPQNDIVIRVRSQEEMMTCFAKALPEIQIAKVALLTHE